LEQLSIGLSPLFEFSNELVSTIYLESRFGFGKDWSLSPRFGATGLSLPVYGEGFSGDNRVGFFYGVGLKYSFEKGGKKRGK